MNAIADVGNDCIAKDITGLVVEDRQQHQIW